MQERAKRKLSAILSAKGGNSLAKPLLEEVIAMEPEWAAGYVGLGMIHLRDVWYRWRDSPLQSMQEAFRLAQEALALKEAFSSLEKRYVMCDKDRKLA